MVNSILIYDVILRLETQWKRDLCKLVDTYKTVV